jgi:hypothetical protein
MLGIDNRGHHVRGCPSPQPSPRKSGERESAIPLFAHVHLSSLLFSLAWISVYILVWLCSQGRLRPRQTGLSARTDARARGAKRQWHAKLIA